MKNVIVTHIWDHGRLTLACNDDIRLDHARVGICIGGHWRFPFESQTAVESQTDWQDNTGVGVCYTLTNNEAEEGLAAQ